MFKALKFTNRFISVKMVHMVHSISLISVKHLIKTFIDDLESRSRSQSDIYSEDHIFNIPVYVASAHQNFL